MADTCPLFYGSILNSTVNFGYTILLTNRKFLSYISLNLLIDVKRSLKRLFKFIKFPERKEGLTGKSLGGTLNLLATKQSSQQPLKATAKHMTLPQG